MKIGRFSTAILVILFLFSSAVLIVQGLWEPNLATLSLADLFGFLALGLILATGAMMLFKGPLTVWMGIPERLWRLHIVIAGAAGLFLGLHVVLLLVSPLSLPILVGYLGTGAALFIWITGSVYFQGARNSMFYHGVFSIGAVFLIVVHTFGAGRNIPTEISGLSLALAAAAVLAGLTWKLSIVWKSGRAADH